MDQNVPRGSRSSLSVVWNQKATWFSFPLPLHPSEIIKLHDMTPSVNSCAEDTGVVSGAVLPSASMSLALLLTLPRVCTGKSSLPVIAGCSGGHFQPPG